MTALPDGLRFSAAAHVDNAAAAPEAEDLINHPPHYTDHPSGVESIQITEHMGFCLGNVIKYIWRAGMKGPTLDDLQKARWYLDREIQRLEPKDQEREALIKFMDRSPEQRAAERAQIIEAAQALPAIKCCTAKHAGGLGRCNGFPVPTCPASG